MFTIQIKAADVEDWKSLNILYTVKPALQGTSI